MIELGGLAEWKFGRATYRTLGEFERAARAHAAGFDDPLPDLDALVLVECEVCVGYVGCNPGDGDHEQMFAKLTAPTDRGFSLGELLWLANNAMFETTRTADRIFLERVLVRPRLREDPPPELAKLPLVEIGCGS